jgi:hypothetical protein
MSNGVDHNNVWLRRVALFGRYIGPSGDFGLMGKGSRINQNKSEGAKCDYKELLHRTQSNALSFFFKSPGVLDVEIRRDPSFALQSHFYSLLALPPASRW